MQREMHSQAARAQPKRCIPAGAQTAGAAGVPQIQCMRQAPAPLRRPQTGRAPAAHTSVTHSWLWATTAHVLALDMRREQG